MNIRCPWYSSCRVGQRGISSHELRVCVCMSVRVCMYMATWCCHISPLSQFSLRFAVVAIPSWSFQNNAFARLLDELSSRPTESTASLWPMTFCWTCARTARATAGLPTTVKNLCWVSKGVFNSISSCSSSRW